MKIEKMAGKGGISRKEVNDGLWVGWMMIYLTAGGRKTPPIMTNAKLMLAPSSPPIK